MRRFLLALCAFVAMTGAAAQDYPSKAVKIVVPFAPGAGNDTLGRLTAEYLTPRLGQPVVVENKAGAGSQIGIDFVAKSPPDGYTLVLIYGSFFIAPAVYSKLGFDPVRDFAPVIQLFNAPIMLSVNPRVPARNVRELIALAKRRPDAITYGTPGIGSGSHLAGELLNKMAGVKLVHVPYKGTAPALTDTIGGQLDILITAVQNTVPHVRAGRLAAIGTTALKRTAVLPDVPAVAETLPGYEVISPYGVLAPGRTPREIVDKLNARIGAALANPEFRRQFEQDGVEIIGGTPDQFRERIGLYLPQYAKLVQSAGVKSE